jgi:hypothetical protein
MPLVAKRKLTETWREAVARRGAERGRRQECLALFDSCVAAGAGEAEAAFETLRRWNCLFVVEGPEDPSRTADAPLTGA